MSLILYCDFDALSTSLSATFRRREPFEPLSSVKRRNRRYWHLSKLLRESVQLFGKNGYDDNSVGPFFCGLNRVLLMPSFAIRLWAPTSTSKSLSVAQHFATNQGLVVTLSNGLYGGGCRLLNHFDVRSVSKYKEENERLWIGGSLPIQMQSVRLVVGSVWKSQQTYVEALYYLDVITSESREPFPLSPEQISILSAFVSGNTSSFPEYVIQTWKLFCIEKKFVIFNMCDEYPSRLRDLMFHSFIGGVDDQDNVDYSEIQSNSNLVRGSFMTLFPNAHVQIMCTDYQGKRSFLFSLDQWMKECIKANVRKCSLIGVCKDRWRGKVRRSWLYYMYSSLKIEDSSISVSLRQRKNAKNEDHVQDVLTFECN